MDRDVDAPVEQGVLDAFREEALPRELVQRAVHLRVALRLDNNDFGSDPVPRERRLHPLGLPQRQTAPTRPDLQHAAHTSPFPLPPAPKCRTRASTSPGTAYSSASIGTGIPSSRAVAAVTGPIAAAANRPEVAASRPTRSTKWRTVEDDVKVMASICPATMSRASRLP